MQKTKITLKKNQYLADLLIEIPRNQTTLIIAPTGIGKTTLTMEQIKEQYEKVVVLVPTQAKVAELQETYSNLPYNNHYLFFFANQNPDESIGRHQGIIVATYDKFEKILKLMSKNQKDKTVLVLDECHKAYSIGAFRDEAMNPIIFALQQRTIPNILLTTATFTEELFAPLEINIDQIFNIEIFNPIQRALKITHLKKGDQHTHIAVLEKKILERQKRNKNFRGPVKPKTILVRINSREKCERAKLYFEMKHGCKCLVVHSKSKNKAEISVIFEKQMLPAGIDIVFTTSIMDEAVNLNNPDFEVDSVFIVGKQTHVEELVQFLGRLRKANVPCEMLLHTEIENTSLNTKQYHQKHLNKMQDYIARVSQVAELMSALVNDYDLDRYAEKNEEGDKQSIYEKIKRMNESFKDWFNCKLFTVYQGKAKQNIASLVANLYRMDATHSYSNFVYLAERIRVFLPNCKIEFNADLNTITPPHIKEFFDEQKEQDERAYDESIDEGISFFLNHFESGQNLEIKTLKDISNKFIKAKSNTEDYLESEVLFASPTHASQMTNVVQDIISLTQHVSNLHDIKATLKVGDTKRVITAGEAYADNEFIRTLVKSFYTRQPEKYFSGEYRLTGTQAAKLLSKAIKQVQKTTHIPMRTIIKQNLIKGMRYDHTSDTFEITESKALNFLSNYFEVQDKNKNKPERRYLEFHGIAVGGYQYLCLEGLQSASVQKQGVFTLGNEKYDSYTGKRKTVSRSLEELIEM